MHFLQWGFSQQFRQQSGVISGSPRESKFCFCLIVTYENLGRFFSLPEPLHLHLVDATQPSLHSGNDTVRSTGWWWWW